MVGNGSDAAVLEVTLGGFVAVPTAGLWVAVTGAGVSHARPEWVAAGERLEVGPPESGVRSYVAVAGGIAVDPVLGSRATDTLAWVGPPRVTEGVVLPVGPASGEPQPIDTPRPPVAGPLRIFPGPHPAYFDDHVLETVCATTYAVRPESNRIGLRLSGPAVARSRETELPSEGMVLGAVQVPPDGQPVVLLADHPATGGYPVVGRRTSRRPVAVRQLRPGEPVALQTRLKNSTATSVGSNPIFTLIETM